MADTTAAERMRRYRQRQRDAAQRHAGKVQIRNCYVTQAAHAMLSVLAERYGDASGALDEAIRQLYATHYREVTSNVTVTPTVDPQVTRQVTPRLANPGQGERRRERTDPAKKDTRRAALRSRVKALRAQGISVNGIARVLNQAGEATLSGLGKWRDKAVKALLDEND